MAVTVLGAAMFLRYSLAGFLRFWMARLVYEQRAQTDRIVGAPVEAPPATGHDAHGERTIESHELGQLNRI